MLVHPHPKLSKLLEKELGDQVSFIYVIKCDSPDSLYKVGYSANPDQRVKKLQTGCPYELSILLTYRGGSKEETRLHHGLKSSKIRREWFNLSEKDLSYIEACKEMGSAFFVVRVRKSDIPRGISL